MIFRMEATSHKKGCAEKHSNYITRRHFTKKVDLVKHGHRNLPEFANNDPAAFWAAADKGERSNGCAMREYTVSLSNVLTDAENLKLCEKIIDELAGSNPVEFAYHRGKGSISGEDHPHLHLAMNERQPDGIHRSAETHFARANPRNPALGGAPKFSGGKSPAEMRIDLMRKKEAICALINAALAENGQEERLDYRSKREQGDARPVEPRLFPSHAAGLTPEEREKMRKLRKEMAKSPVVAAPLLPRQGAQR